MSSDGSLLAWHRSWLLAGAPGLPAQGCQVHVAQLVRDFVSSKVGRSATVPHVSRFAGLPGRSLWYTDERNPSTAEIMKRDITVPANPAAPPVLGGPAAVVSGSMVSGLAPGGIPGGGGAPMSDANAPWGATMPGADRRATVTLHEDPTPVSPMLLAGARAGVTAFGGFGLASNALGRQTTRAIVVSSSGAVVHELNPMRSTGHSSMRAGGAQVLSDDSRTSVLYGYADPGPKGGDWIESTLFDDQVAEDPIPTEAEYQTRLDAVINASPGTPYSMARCDALAAAGGSVAPISQSYAEWCGDEDILLLSVQCRRQPVGAEGCGGAPIECTDFSRVFLVDYRSGSGEYHDLTALLESWRGDPMESCSATCIDIWA